MTDAFRQPVAAVTGASRGVGRATAVNLARHGYRVFAMARSVDELKDLAREAAGAHLDVEPIELDVANPRSREEAVAAVLAATAGYGVDVLVNNAGYGQLGAMEDVSVDQLERQFAVNVFGLHALTRAFLPHMRDRRHGRIVNLSSAAGRISAPFMGAYSASKFAVEAMSDALRVELAPWNIAVILIEPGPIRTSFGEAASLAGDASSEYAPFRRRWEGSRGAENLWETSPEAVARRIAQAIAAERPRARYAITLSARAGAVARRLAPDRLLDWFFKHMIGATQLHLPSRRGFVRRSIQRHD